MQNIKGWQKTSLINYSPYTVSVIFLGGCSFKCGFCHNPELVLHHTAVPDIDEKEILDYLKQKKMWIDGVCITGGEPTIHKDLPDFISKLKKLKLKVKLDTNGSNPKMLAELLKKVDYVAMDIKTNLNNYDSIAGVEVNKKKIEKSIRLIRDSDVDYEFRSTVIPGLVGKKEIFLIGKMLKGSKKFVIQNFRGSKPLINNKLREINSFSGEELEAMKEVVSPYFDKVEIR